jgi:hypothetical protein
MATSTELAAAILAAQQATAAEVIAIDGLTQVSQDLVQRITDDSDGWDGAIIGLAAQVAATNNLDNTSDADKPVSTAQQTAIDLKQDTIVSATHIKTLNGQAIVGSGDLVITFNADPTPVVAYDDRATLRSLDPEADEDIIVEGIGTLTWVASTDEPDDDDTCFTTSSGQFLLRVPAWDWTNAQLLFSNGVLADWMEDEPTRLAAAIAASS